MANEGRFYHIKSHLLSLIEKADPSLHVYPDWKISITRIRNFPIATVRITGGMIGDETYNRSIDDSHQGSIASYNFSIHIFASNCKVNGEPKAKYAHELADKIITQLKTNRKDNSTGIFDISDIRARESEPSQGVFNISRVIVEGLIWAKRPD